MRDHCHRHLFYRDECGACEKVRRNMKYVDRIRMRWAEIQRRLPSKERPLFKDHSPDAWYLQPASPKFQSHSWFLFLLISILILGTMVGLNGGI